MTKKLTAVLLCLLLALTFALPALAEDAEPAPDIVVTAFADLGEAAHLSAFTGAEEAALGLPAALTATAEGEEPDALAIQGVTWQCATPDGYQKDVAGAYAFAPTLPAGYVLGPGVAAPTVTVTLAAPVQPAANADNAAPPPVANAAPPAPLAAPAGQPTYTITPEYGPPTTSNLMDAFIRTFDGNITLTQSGTENASVFLADHLDDHPYVLDLNGCDLTLTDRLLIIGSRRLTIQNTSANPATLTISPPNGPGISVYQGGALTVEDSVTCAVSSQDSYGIDCQNSTVIFPGTVTTVTGGGLHCIDGTVRVADVKALGADGWGVVMTGAAAQVTVTGSVSAGHMGMGAYEGVVRVGGSVTATGPNSKGIDATDSEITVDGDVQGTYAGVEAANTRVTVGGSVTGGRVGIVATSGSAVTAQNATATDDSATGAGVGAGATGPNTLVTLSGAATGAFAGAYAAAGGHITAQNATATGVLATGTGIGALAADPDSLVALSGNATGASDGAYAWNGGHITAQNATATGDLVTGLGAGAYAVGADSLITLTGDATGVSEGAYAWNGGHITARNATSTSVTGLGAGADADGADSLITLTGDATGYAIGARAWNGGHITARNATATTPNYSSERLSSAGAFSSGTGSHIQLSGEARGYHGASVLGISATFAAASATATGERGVGLAAFGDGLGPHQTRPDVGWNAVITGAVTGVRSGVSAQGNTWVQAGSITATGNTPKPDDWSDDDGVYWQSRGIFVADDSRVHVLGDVNCQLGVQGGRGQVQVDGSIRATNLGVSAGSGLVVTVEGTITSPTPAQFSQFISYQQGSVYHPKTWADSAQDVAPWQDYRLFTDANVPNAVVRVRNLPPPAPTPPSSPAATTPTAASPQTGDPASAMPYALALLGACGLGGAVLLRRKKRSRWRG